MSPKPRSPIAAACLVLSAALFGGCPRSSESSDDPNSTASVDGAGDSVDVLAESAQPDVDGAGEGGRLTLVVTEWAPVPERLCDLDGDGREDNALAELGPTMGEVFAATIASLLAGTVEAGSRLVLHLPWVGDLALADEPAPQVHLFEGRDTDSPRDPTDDFSGEEPFWAQPEYLDGCGEPTSVSTEASLDSGALTARFAEADLHLVGDATLFLRELRLTGEIASRGSGISAMACGAAPLRALGPSGSLMGSGLNLLEELLRGGAAFGVPTVPGLTPDLDLDGDGLESFVVDSDGRIVSCVDGDRTVIEGRDCWDDDRIADAFSMTFTLGGVGARFAGRVPCWEFMVDGDCPDGPPEESLFDSPADAQLECAGSEERCDPQAPVPCCDPLDTCSGENCQTHRCYRTGCSPQRCEYGSEPGYCINPGYLPGGDGLCAPLSRHIVYATPCEVETQGCTTDYGATGDTWCSAVGLGYAQCREVCPLLPNDCDPGFYCSPRRFYDDGVCVNWPD